MKSTEASIRPWGEAGPAVRFAEDVDAASRAEIATVLTDWAPELFPGGEVEISNLVGGASNRNFVVRTPDVKYALRIANAQSERFAVNREASIQAQREASRGGLAPEVMAVRLPEGHVLSTFIEGPILTSQLLEDPAVLETVGATLRRLHAQPSSLPTYSTFDEIRLWSGLARSDGTEIPGELEELFEPTWEVEAAIEAAGLPLAFCHNDPYPPNFILTDSRLQLVDWDYAGRGWACFELGSFCATADLEGELREVLLSAYDERTTDAQRASVQLMSFVAAMREATWAVMATPILRGTMTPASGDDFYDDHLRTYLGLARKRASAPDFHELTKLAVGGGGSRSW